MQTFDISVGGRTHFINNAVGSDARRLFESAHIARSSAINSGMDVDLLHSSTGEVVASYQGGTGNVISRAVATADDIAALAPDRGRTWPPADSSMISRADWAH